MERVSSNFTIFYKIFVPIFWIVFVFAFTIATWVWPGESALLSDTTFRYGITAFLFAGILLLYFTMVKLKRVEFSPEFIYVTNYVKTYRYPYHQVSKINEMDFILFKTIYIHFLKKGSFGKKIYFVADRKRYKSFISSHPELFTHLI